MSWNFEGWFPLDADCLTNIWIQPLLHCSSEKSVYNVYTMDASCKDSYFSSNFGVKAFSDHCIFLTVQPVVIKAWYYFKFKSLSYSRVLGFAGSICKEDFFVTSFYLNNIGYKKTYLIQTIQKRKWWIFSLD